MEQWEGAEFQADIKKRQTFPGLHTLYGILQVLKVIYVINDQTS